MTWDEHLKYYKGIPTKSKLKLLAGIYGLSAQDQEDIWKLKQELTQSTFDMLEINEQKVAMLKYLSQRYKLVACSNAIRDSVEKMLFKSGYLPYFEFFLSNQDIKHSKPHPEIYTTALDRLGVLPSEALVVEDAEVGRESARKAGCHLCAVDCPEDVTLERILFDIKNLLSPAVVIPMAGEGKRFLEAGYTFPKPLIETIDHKPMIQLVVENINLPEYKHIFVCRGWQYRKYALKYLLALIAPNSKSIVVDELTDGAACTVLKASNYFDNANELIIANSDQIVGIEVKDFVSEMREKNADGGILCFESTHPKWSYARVENDRVVEVAEKKPISHNATVGIYYFKHGRDFIKYANRMIVADKRVNNEFYICPVFNEMIADNKFIAHSRVETDQMFGLGDPESLERFLSSWSE
jgi:HAD superfamily hydrolase (TIGR01509 family)